MNICGLQKVTLLDYPNLVACTIFTRGCNFCCPFCHNAGLVIPSRYDKLIPEEEIIAYLESRKRILDGVCITGGEPTLQKDLIEFIRKVKSLGFKVKLDTNGYNPEVLSSLLDEKLLDYIAMDIKNSPTKYPVTVGKDQLDFDKIRRSISLITSSEVPYEFRTTVCKELHEVEDFDEIAELIKGTKAYYIQNFRSSDNLISPLFHSCSIEDLRLFKQRIQVHQIPCEIRGDEE